MVNANDVVLELSPEELQNPLPRNLTLVLKSDKPVKWVIKSKGITGQLVIAAGKNNINQNIVLGGVINITCKLIHLSQFRVIF